MTGTSAPPSRRQVYDMTAAMSPGTGATNTPPPVSIHGSLWTEHRNAQGRVYWYHKVDRKSVWEKPTELKTAREKALDSTPWKEYQSGDRKYYVHSVTKESTWSLPKELQQLFDALPNDTHSPNATASSTAAVVSPFPVSTPHTHLSHDTQSPHPQTTHATAQTSQRPIYTGPPPGFESPVHGLANSNIERGSSSPMQGMRGSSTLQHASAPQGSASVPHSQPLQTAATAFVGGGEDAFMQLLRTKGVNTTWTWEQTMREIITDPLYKALKTLAERKAAFSKYVRTLKEEAENAQRQKAKALEPAIRQSLEGLIAAKRIESWLSYEGMLLRCSDTSVWRQLEAISQDAARSLWSTICDEMKSFADEAKHETRRRNKDVLMKLLKQFEADVTTRWKDAYQTILESDEWQSDEKLREMDMGDMIGVFDELIKSIEVERKQEMRQDDKKRKREDRIRRDWFRAALQQGKQHGWLTVKTTFGEVYNRFKDQAQFQQMLGQHGSSPLDLFYDVLDQMDVEVEKLVRIVQNLFDAQMPPVRIKQGSTFDEFKQSLDAAVQRHGQQQQDSPTASSILNADKDTLELVHEEFAQRAEDEERRIERKLRHLSEDVRYALKKLAHHQPDLFSSSGGEEARGAVDEAELDKPWEEWKVRLEALHLREWQAFEQTSFQIEAERIDEARKAAWAKFVSRQKEKLAEKRASAAGVETGAASANANLDSLLPVSRKRRLGTTGVGRMATDSQDVDGHDDDDNDADLIGISESIALEQLRKKTMRDDKRRERRAGYLDEPSAAKRARKGEGEDEDSEKEEGEV